MARTLDRNEIKALAAELDVSVQTIRRGIKAGMPLAESGPLDIEGIRLWFRARARKAQRRGPNTNPVGVYSSDQRKLYGGGPLTPEEKFLPPGQEGAASSEALASVEQELAAYRKWRAEKEKLLVQKLRGELMERQAVADMVAGWVRAFSRGLLALEGRVAHLCTPEARALIKSECRDLLEAIASNGEKLEGET